jgi:hypothetical protein
LSYDILSSKLLGKLIGANMNVTTDQLIKIYSKSYIPTKIIVKNVSTNLTLAAGGIYTSDAKGGSAIVPFTQVYSALTGATKYLSLTLAALALTDILTNPFLYLSLTTAQGGAATADIYIFGDTFN